MREDGTHQKNGLEIECTCMHAKTHTYTRESTTYRTIVASCDRSRRWAASTADTMAPSSAERSHISSVTKNFLARLKNAAGPFVALTAMTCRGLSSGFVADVDACVDVGIDGPRFGC